MNVLHIDSSVLGAQSASRKLSSAIVSALIDRHPDLTVVYRDLEAQPLPHLSGRSLAQADPDEASQARRALEEFKAADIVVLGAPMYNFSIPSSLKAWIDRVAVAGETFRYNAQGQAEGLCGNKQVFVASSRGGLHQHDGMDFQEPYLRAVLGFMGITDIRFVRAEGLAVSPAQRDKAMAQALAVAGAAGAARPALAA